MQHWQAWEIDDNYFYTIHIFAMSLVDISKVLFAKIFMIIMHMSKSEHKNLTRYS